MSEPVAPASPAKRLLGLRDKALQRVLALGIVLVGSALVLVWPERVTGLHVDEAWSFFRAREILSGQRPLDGMNYYTGAIHQYLLAMAVKLFGLHHWVIRLISGAANVAALIAYMRLVRLWHPDDDTWLWTGALTMTSATFVVYSRLGIELTTFTPMLVFGGVLLMQGARGAKRFRSWQGLSGGILLGLAIYNHMVAAAVVGGIMLGYVVASGVHAVRERITFAALAGIALGVTPRIVQLLGRPARGAGPLQRLQGNLSPELLTDMRFLPELLRGMFEGDLIYQRVAGGCLIRVVPFVSIAAISLVGARIKLRAYAVSRRDLGVFAATAGSALLMALISPHLALRYYILPALALPYFLARLANLPARSRWALAWGRGSLIAVLALQAFYLGTNYFYAHLSTGGKIHVFPLGKNILEASNGFVRIDRLYAQLVERRIGHAVADNLIRWPLEFYDLTPDNLRTTAQPNQRGWRVPKDAPTAIIHYNGPTPYGALTVSDLTGTERLEVQGRTFVLEPGFDQNFRVYVHRPKT